MFIDARTIPSESSITADLCIVGAGAAGITLARALADGKRDVILLESGGFDYEAATQDLYAGAVVGQQIPPIDSDRLRFFGGTTNHWSGSCKPFDPLDFEARAWIPNSGWPFGRAELEPYYRRAQAICQLGPWEWNPAHWAEAGAGPFDLGDAASLSTGVFQNSPPTRFGAVYRDDLAQAARLKVLLHANVVEIETGENASEVSRARVACLEGGRRFWITARHYVLATGGIENARLLLNCDKIATPGLGNGADLVGRYFMDHPNIWKSATVVFSRSFPNLPFYADFPVVRGTKVYGFFTPTAEAQRAEKLPNFSIALDRGQLADESEGIASLRSVYKSVRAGQWPEHLGFHLRRIVGDLGGEASVFYHRALHDEPPTCSTFYSCECPPDPESRVTLLRDRDALGLRRAQLDWRLPSDFAANMARAHELLAHELGRAGIGRLRLNPTETSMSNIDNGHHHMGTTRMHENPQHGVVDADCRVHGIDNLFIAGSSVFPTYSHDDPTMTIVALALRLADHLSKLEA